MVTYGHNSVVMANPDWVKGHSGNPHGRPKGFAGVAKLIMKATRDGAELVEWALCVWRDPIIEMRHREEAFKWLSDRGLGKPLQQLELGAPGSFDDDAIARAEELTDAQLEELVEIDRRKAAILGGHRVQDPKALDG